MVEIGIKLPMKHRIFGEAPLVLDPNSWVHMCLSQPGGFFTRTMDRYGWLVVWNMLFYHIWVGLKIVYIPNEIAIFHRDNDQQNHWV